MHKGFYTQGLVVLLRRAVAIEELRALIERDQSVAAQKPANREWVIAGPSLLLRYRHEVNGLAPVDVVDRPWPDDMGDPKTESMLFCAWSTGQFGPFTYPAGLRRAIEHAWAWPAARDAVPGHAAFVRIRLSYVFGAPDEDRPVIPADCDPVDELEFVTRVARALLEHPDALCLFVPGGELLLDAATLGARLDHAEAGAVPALDAWCNVRLFRLPDGWTLMDTIGNAQLDLPDLEAAFPADRFDPGEVDAFLRNASLYLLERGEVVANGDTMDGPGGLRWQAWAFEGGVLDPPRPVLRWLPIRPAEERDASPVPLALLPAEEAERRAREARPPWWKRWVSSGGKA